VAADDLVDDWALALPSATIMERIAKPDIRRHLCWSVMGRDYQEFRARGRFSSLADEPFAEDDGELGLGLEPLARRPFPFVSRVVQNQV